MPDLSAATAGLFEGMARSRIQGAELGQEEEKIRAQQMEGSLNRGADLMRTGISQLGETQRSREQQAGETQRKQMELDSEMITISPNMAQGMAKQTGDVGFLDFSGKKMKANVLIPLYGHVLSNNINQLKLEQKIAAAEEKKTAEPTEKEQDALEKQAADRLDKIVSFRSGGLGLQDSKVNQAIDLRTMINQNYDPKTGNYNIPPSLHSELVLGLARLISPTGQVGIELEQELRQKTAREGIASMAIYMGIADPKKVGGPTQDVVKLFVDSIDRQGETSQKLRDKYMQDQKDLFPSRLDKERKQRLEQQVMGSSFDKLLKESPDYGKRSDSVTAKGLETKKPDLKVGDIKKGYRFKGGDPSDSQNWEEVK